MRGTPLPRLGDQVAITPMTHTGAKQPREWGRSHAFERQVVADSGSPTKVPEANNREAGTSPPTTALAADAFRGHPIGVPLLTEKQG